MARKSLTFNFSLPDLDDPISPAKDGPKIYAYNVNEVIDLNSSKNTTISLEEPPNELGDENNLVFTLSLNNNPISSSTPKHIKLIRENPLQKSKTATMLCPLTPQTPRSMKVLSNKSIDINEINETSIVECISPTISNTKPLNNSNASANSLDILTPTDEYYEQDYAAYQESYQCYYPINVTNESSFSNPSEISFKKDSPNQMHKLLPTEDKMVYNMDDIENGTCAHYMDSVNISRKEYECGVENLESIDYILEKASDALQNSDEKILNNVLTTSHTVNLECDENFSATEHQSVLKLNLDTPISEKTKDKPIKAKSKELKKITQLKNKKNNKIKPNINPQPIQAPIIKNKTKYHVKCQTLSHADLIKEAHKYGVKKLSQTRLRAILTNIYNYFDEIETGNKLKTNHTSFTDLSATYTKNKRKRLSQAKKLSKKSKLPNAGIIGINDPISCITPTRPASKNTLTIQSPPDSGFISDAFLTKSSSNRKNPDNNVVISNQLISNPNISENDLTVNSIWPIEPKSLYERIGIQHSPVTQTIEEVITYGSSQTNSNQSTFHDMQNDMKDNSNSLTSNHHLLTPTKTLKDASRKKLLVKKLSVTNSMLYEYIKVSPFYTRILRYEPIPFDEIYTHLNETYLPSLKITSTRRENSFLLLQSPDKFYVVSTSQENKKKKLIVTDIEYQYKKCCKNQLIKFLDSYCIIFKFDQPKGWNHKPKTARQKR